LTRPTALQRRGNDLTLETLEGPKSVQMCQVFAVQHEASSIQIEIEIEIEIGIGILVERRADCSDFDLDSDTDFDFDEHASSV
jgi:hypothetical protein